ncbi:FAD dependent oxidoreductase [Candidatus Sulfotelmatobacter kueseliae]|uniref:FAD dependent oxidoreductase n=1 Tax=Candidatus Sulfotelmatobacter kueseliae TaxID=2042962 RepID=A0A2U3KYA4_9BACT|nr:FAD dependent oxidoreductase [Candidatus Sulfotelmatobacter kueseliae]
MFEQNYWLTTTEMPAADGARPLPEGVDVAVIGAGFTGLSAARTLARRGAKVAVLESETIGWGASSRNGGMVLTGMKLGPTQLISKYGRELTQRMYAASLASMDCVEKIVEEERIACDFSRCGHLEVACKPKHFDDYARQAEIMAREFNHTLRVVQKNELSSEIGSTIYYGGMVDEVSAGCNPARYVAGLARAAIKAGAEIFEHARVQTIQRDSRQGEVGWKITTSRGPLWAHEVFVATSGYTGSATPALQKRIIPIGSFIITTEVLPEKLAQELSPRNRMIYDSKNYLYYYRLTPDRRMLFGGRAAFFPENDQTIRRSAALLRHGMISVYPQLAEAKIDYVWGGTLDFAFDIMPHAGQLDGMYYALGYAGHGVAMATYQGQKIAELMASDRRGGDKPENPFVGIHFPCAPLGLYNGRPWFLPLAGAWYKFLDWVS